MGITASLGPGTQKGERLALLSIILITAAIVIPALFRARIAANEAAAVDAIRTVNTAARAYLSKYGHFPEDLHHMGGPASPNDPASAERAKLISGLLAFKKQKSGYTFDLQAKKDKYTINARPLKFGSTGKRSFFSDESGVIRFTTENRPAKDSDPPVK